VWAAGYAVGPGFANGTGTGVALRGFTLGPLPAFPLLAALPSAPAPRPRPGWCSPVPLIAVVAGVLCATGTRRPAEGGAGWATAAAATAGLAFAVLAALSGDRSAPRLTAIGPSAVEVGLAAAVELAVLAAPGRRPSIGWSTQARHPPNRTFLGYRGRAGQAEPRRQRSRATPGS